MGSEPTSAAVVESGMHWGWGRGRVGERGGVGREGLREGGGTLTRSGRGRGLDGGRMHGGGEVKGGS